MPRLKIHSILKILIIGVIGVQTIYADDIFEFKRFLILPIYAYSEEAGSIFGAGAMIFIVPPAADGASAGSSNSIAFMSSLKKQATFINKFVYESQNGRSDFVGYLYLTNWPTQFFGIGNDLNEDDYDIYTSKGIRVPLTLGTDFFFPQTWQGRLRFGVETDLEYITFDYEKDFSKLSTDFKNSARAGVGYNLTYNSGERNDWPRKGSFVQFRHIFFYANNNNSQKAKSFIWRNMDVRTYIPLPFLPEGVLALSSYLEDFDGDVPFDRLAQPDGVGQLRGLTKGLLADKTSWVLQSELRTHLFWRCKGTLFYEAAKVGNSFYSLNKNKFHESIGIGGRFMVNSKSKTHIRGDVALIDRKNVGMAIKINEAF
jgi:hypothetical protein